MNKIKSCFLLILSSFLLVSLFFSCEDEEIMPEQAQNRSVKRGVSYSFQIPEDDANLMGKGVSWFYNWGANITPTVNTAVTANKIDFFPMAWNGNFNANAIRSFKLSHPECEYILAYNEPNLTDQANMTPKQAADIWPALKAIATELNMKIVSPAMNYGTLSGYGDPIVWLDEFFTLIPASDVDVIAIHCYMANASALAWYVNRFRKYNKPVWLTEFCAWEKSITNANDQLKFMCDAVNYLEADSIIARYAWFIPRSGGAIESYPFMQLLTKTTPYALTPLGNVYVNMSTQDKTIYYPEKQQIPAAHYSSLNMAETIKDRLYSPSVRVRPCTDTDGKLELFDFLPGYWVEYQIETTGKESKLLHFRYACAEDAAVTISVDGELLASCNLIKTGAESSWSTVSTPINITAGKHIMRIKLTNGKLVLNWLSVTKE
jgi:hypothetical protein